MSAELERLAALVQGELGLELPAGRLPFLAEVARRRAPTAGCTDLAAYVDALSRDALRGEWDALASLLTIQESSFFRAPQQWEQLRARLLPELAERRASTRRLSAWSAACAGGEEPGTLALLLADMPAFSGWDWSILATDVDPEALAHAARAHYGERAVAAVPEALRKSFLAPRGALWELDPRLRERIRLRRLNLAQPAFRLPEAPFDLIFLRNVLIYFRPELQRRVVSEAARHLASDGWLFLGGSETLWRVHDGLEAVDLGSCFAYRLAKQRSQIEPRRPGPTEAAAKPGPSKRRDTPDGPRGTPSPGGAETPTATERLVGAANLLEGRRPDEARTEVDRVLADDPADPAAHALSGLISASVGETGAAADAFRAALYLEPGLAQVRLLLADGLRALGEEELADRQYREVLNAIERGAGRDLVALTGRLLPDAEESVRRARAALGRAATGG